LPEPRDTGGAAGAPAMNVEPLDRHASWWLAAAGLSTGLAMLSAAWIAAWLLPMVADEPDDFALMLGELNTLSGLFTQPAAASDQSRLPHLLSLPVAWIFRHDGNAALVAVRSLFLLFHAAYLYLSFRLIAAVSCRNAAWVYVLLLAVSCYLSSFAVFAMTTSDALFLLFHVACMYRFYLSWSDERSNGVFSRPVLLALLLGLCVASKLFGVFLLGALFAFHALFSPSAPVRLRGTDPVLVAVGSGIFLAVIATINMAFLAQPVKQALAFGTAGIYLLFIVATVLREGRAESAIYETNRLWLWAGIGLTSFNLTLVFSPIYLNFENLLSLLNWVEEYNTGMLVADSNWWDIVLIMLMKFGFVSAATLLVPIGVYLWKRRGRPSSFMFLIALIFVVQLVVISAVRHKVTWYPLAIFPLLYLPFAWLAVDALRSKSRRLLALALLTLVIVAGDNLWRYAHWYPYGHFDGAQYGNEYIGWNRAGLVSFEVLPLLDRFLARLRVPEGREVRVSNQVIAIPRYRDWLTRMLASRYATVYPDLKFSGTMETDGDTVDLILTSPVYNPELEQRLQRSEFKRLTVLTLKKIHIVSIWGRARP